jgi:CHAT domain-containing protein
LRVDARRNAPRAIAAIALPSGDSPALPAGSAELDEIARLYAGKTVIPAERATIAALQDAAARADVLHIAGHTERQPGGGEDALLFAGRNPVTWRGIAVHPLSRAKIVIVAACETLRVPRSAQSRAMSVGGGFLAAGARDVIGTLTPIADEQARVIFTSVHRSLARGVEASESLRNAQLEALAEETAGRHRTAWRAVALLTTRIPRATK